MCWASSFSRFIHLSRKQKKKEAIQKVVRRSYSLSNLFETGCRCSLRIIVTRCKRARNIDSNADSKKPYGIACARPDTTLTLPFRRLAQLYSRINDAAGMRHRFMLAKHYNTQRVLPMVIVNSSESRKLLMRSGIAEKMKK